MDELLGLTVSDITISNSDEEDIVFLAHVPSNNEPWFIWKHHLTTKSISKILSDGTIAKVGLIVVVDCDGYFNNETTVITSVYPEKTKDIDDTGICLKSNQGHNIFTKEKSFWIYTNKVRKATPEERKQYYQKLWNK